MKLDNLTEGKAEGDTLTVARTAWNRDFLEYWVKCTWETGTTIESTGDRDLLFAFATVKKLFTNYEGFARCKDGTVVPDAFALSDEDLEADDWVIL